MNGLEDTPRRRLRISIFSVLALRRGEAGSFYFAENGEEEELRGIVERIAQMLELPVRSLHIERAIALWGREPAVYALGSNSRVSLKRARRDLGWKPLHSSLIQDLAARGESGARHFGVEKWCAIGGKIWKWNWETRRLSPGFCF